MNQHLNQSYPVSVYYRLIALWATCEAFAGGIMHAAKVPFTGMIISSLAIICISLIAWHFPSKGSVLKATIIVAIFKLMLSPHSPPTAYIAVFFQGLMGQLLLSNKKYFRAATVLLAVLALVESAVQRILVLVIIYGNQFWHAIDEFIRKTTGQKQVTQYSSMLAVGYITLHAIVGIFIGFVAARIATASNQWRTKYPELLITQTNKTKIEAVAKNQNRFKIKWLFILLFSMLLFLFIQAYLDPGHPILPMGKVTWIILRASLLIFAWYLLIGPLLMTWLKSMLGKQRSKYREEIEQVAALIPQTKDLFTKAIRASAKEKGLARLKYFLKALLVNTIAG